MRSGIVVFALALLPHFSQAQINFSYSKDDEIREKYIPITDGTVNMEPIGKEGVKYDWSVSAQKEFYKAFIGQKILFYGCRTINDYWPNIFVRLVKNQVIDFPEKTNINTGLLDFGWSWHAGNYLLTDIPHKIITHIPYDKEEECWITVNASYSRNSTIINLELDWKFDENILNHFFTIKDILTKEEAQNLITENNTVSSPQMRLPGVQKRLDKLGKKRLKGKLKKEEEITEYEQLQNAPFYYLVEADKLKEFKDWGKEEAYSQTLKGDTLIDFFDIVFAGYEPPVTHWKDFNKHVPIWNNIVYLVADEKGTEYLIYHNQLGYKEGGDYITENHLNYLKEQYVGQDFARLFDDGSPDGDILRCDELVIRDGSLKAKCHVHNTNEIKYFSLHHFNGEYSLDGRTYEMIAL